MPESEQIQELPFPERGMDVSNALSEQRPLTTAEAMNVRGYDLFKQRLRGGQRTGLGRVVDDNTPGAGLIQDLGTVVRIAPEAVASPSVLGGGGGDGGGGGAGSGDFPGGEPIDPTFFEEPRPPGDDDWVQPPDPTLPPVRSGGTGNQPVGQKSTPDIIWDDPADIFKGTPLSETELDATAVDRETGDPVDGTFTYSPPAGTVLPEGTHTLRVVFEPEDETKYYVTASSVQINVVTSMSFDTPGTYTWTAPPGVTSITVECWGGGQAGNTGAAGLGSAGGAGGSFAQKVVTVVPGNNYTVTVGAGGASAFLPGGDSWFSTTGTVQAKGGGSASSNVGDTTFTGGNGAGGQETAGGGGGSSAGTASNGNAATTQTGAAAVSGGGAGGDGGNAGAAGSAGSFPGGGGGGGGNAVSAGGAGAGGKVTVSW
jgi:hypothetical protein